MTKSGEVFSGEKISESEDRWFWEEASGLETMTLFEVVKDQPIFHQIRKSQVENEQTLFIHDSVYENYIISHKFYIQQAPLKGWNFIATGNDGHHLYEKLSGNFAWDIVKTFKGQSYKSDGVKNSDFYVWQKDVFAPVSGTLVGLMKSQSDNLPDLSLKKDLSQNGDGNFILIHLGGPFYFVLLHLKKDSNPENLVIGQEIKAGDFLGQVGNSGTSYLPHLHMTLYYWNESLKRFISIPTFFKDLILKDTQTSSSKVMQNYKPETGQKIRTPLSN